MHICSAQVGGAALGKCSVSLLLLASTLGCYASGGVGRVAEAAGSDAFRLRTLRGAALGAGHIPGACRCYHLYLMEKQTSISLPLHTGTWPIGPVLGNEE